jgi:hypothetical protein
MKNIFLVFIFFQIQAFAGNTSLEVNQVNCKKIDGYGKYEIEAIASKYQVSMASVKFVGANWGPGQYGGNQCNMVFDTPKGPKRCNTFMIFTDDNGKTAFGLAVPQRENNPVCF